MHFKLCVGAYFILDFLPPHCHLSGAMQCPERCGSLELQSYLV
jgi:hypothetical protein